MAVLTIAEVWEKNNLVEEGFSGYLQDETKISFPWSMIDKITPRPDSKIKEMLERTGLEGMDIFTTSANTYIAPFVNAEETEYLVIEDNFPNGRPKLEHAGILFADRRTGRMRRTDEGLHMSESASYRTCHIRLSAILYFYQ